MQKIDFRIKIHTTSIAKKFFFKTYDIISEIIINVSGQKTIIESALQNYKNDLEIILHYDNNKRYEINDLFLDLNLFKENAIFHLNRLKRLGFVELEETSKSFKLTERVNFFKYGLESQKKEYKINKILEMLFIFSNLNQKSI